MQKKRRKGFVLILVLVMLTVAGLLSAGMARRALDQTVVAARKTDAFQRRWGEISLRHAVLNRAEILLRTAELQERGRQPTLRTTITLGGKTFQLILSDEQAKWNMNTAFRYGRESAVRSALFEEGTPWPIRLRPDPRATATGSSLPTFACWGQLYDFSDAAKMPDKQELPLTGLGERITCWGNGQLNGNRAEIGTIRAVCELVAPPQSATALLELRQKQPEWGWEKLLQEADIPDRDRRAFRLVLTDRSRCHSLWTITSDGNRSWIRFDVKTADEFETFYW